MASSNTARTVINLLIILSLVFSIVITPAGAVGDNTGLKPVWNFEVDGAVSVIKSNEYGTEWYVGTKTGFIYKFDEYGNEVWDNPIRHQFNTVTDLVISNTDDTLVAFYKSNGYATIYFIDLNSLEIWHQFGSDTHTINTVNDKRRWYTAFTPKDGDSASYICYMDRNNADLFLAPTIDTNTLGIIPSEYLDFKPYNMLVAASTNNPKDLVSISLNSFPDLAILPSLDDMPYSPDFPEIEYYSPDFLEIEYDSSGVSVTNTSGLSVTNTYYDLLQTFPHVNIYTISPNVVSGSRDYYTQDTVIYRNSGTDSIDSDGVWHIYLGYDCRPDYANLRFYDYEGIEIPYYIEDYDVVSANIILRIPESSQTEYMLIGYGGTLTTTNSNKEDVFEFIEPFNTSIDPNIWNSHTDGGGSVEIVPNEYVRLHAPARGGVCYATLVSKKAFDGDFIFDMECWHSNSNKFYLHDLGLFNSNYADETSGYIHNDANKLPVRYHIEQLTSSNNKFHAADANTDVVLTTDEAWHNYKIKREGLFYTLIIDNDNSYTLVESIPAPSYQLAFTQVRHNANTFYTLVKDVSVRGLASTPSEIQRGSLSVLLPSTIQSSVSSPITNVKIADNHILIQTTNSLHTYEIGGDGTLSLATQVTGLTGTPYTSDITNDGLIMIEGRGPTVDIYRYDGIKTGTYDTGGIISNTELSRANGLYALATSADGKYYIFSKDEASMWYMLYSSPTGAEITASHLTEYADYIAIARGSNLQICTLEEADEVVRGLVTLRVYDRAKPYANSDIIIQHSTDGVWADSETHTTDSQGVVVVEAEYGKKINIIIGDNIHTQTLIPTPAQPEYIIQIPTEEPLRSGANYKSWYDGDTNRIYFSFQDLKGKTSKVEFTIIRASDNTQVYARNYYLAYGDTSEYIGYFYIVEDRRDTSYRVQIIVHGSPSFTNSWHQWIPGAGGVASLPIELSDTIKTGIFIVLLLFTGGIFSYFSGPHGAVVVALMAGVFVLWGWLPISPAVVGLCIIWAFLGLLGRTSIG